MAANAPEKSKFIHTCSLLSQYLKEKGGLDTLRRGIGLDFNQTGMHHIISFPGSLEEDGGRPETIDLHPQMGSTKRGLQLHCDEFPDLNASPSPELSSPRDADVPTAVETPKSAAQLTMFYAGRVVVFDDFPADKAKELMLLASQACPQDAGASPIKKAPPISSAVPEAGSLPSEKHNPALPWSNPLSPSPARRLADISDLPIARKNSLNRFLEKRKDRISAKAPYPAPPAPAGSAKPPEGSWWLGLTSQSD